MYRYNDNDDKTLEYLNHAIQLGCAEAMGARAALLISGLAGECNQAKALEDLDNAIHLNSTLAISCRAHLL